MKPDEIDEVLLATLEDARLSRSERRALSAVFGDHADDDRLLDFFRHRAFEIARERVSGAGSREVVGWLSPPSARPSTGSGTATGSRCRGRRCR